jgi:hypothetical protein
MAAQAENLNIFPLEKYLAGFTISRQHQLQFFTNQHIVGNNCENTYFVDYLQTCYLCVAFSY